MAASGSASGSKRARTKNVGHGLDPLNISKLLTTEEQKKRFLAHFLERPILNPKYGILESFSSAGLEFPEMLEYQGMSDFISLRGSYYPELVKVFYCNLRLLNNRLVSQVKGIDIVMTLEDLGNCLGLPYEGRKLSAEILCPWQGFNRKSFYQSLCRFSEAQLQEKRQRLESARSRDILPVGPLTAGDRLLHYFLSYVLLPQVSNHAQISDLELQIMYGLKTKEKINWAYLVQQHMLLQCERAGALPYAPAISQIFQNYGVPVEGEFTLKVDVKSQKIDTDILPKMGIYKDVDGVFRHKADSRDSTPPRPPSTSATSSPTIPPPGFSSDNPYQMILERLDHMQAAHTARFDHIDGRIDSIHTDLRGDIEKLAKQVEDFAKVHNDVSLDNLDFPSDTDLMP